MRPEFAPDRPTGEGELVELLESGWKAGRSSWPGVELEPRDFAEHVISRAESARGRASFQGLHLADLYLAKGLELGIPAAFDAFEQQVFPNLEQALRRAGSGDELDDLKQQVRQRLFVAAQGGRPRISEYVGTGSLVAWGRMVMLRTFYNSQESLQHRAPHQELTEDVLLGEGVEVEHLKRHYLQEFREAFRDATQALSPEERTLLRQHFLDGLSSEPLAALYGVHRATVSRWIVRAQEQLATRTRQALSERLGTRPEELASILRLIQSRLDASVKTLLSSDIDDGKDP